MENPTRANWTGGSSQSTLASVNRLCRVRASLLLCATVLCLGCGDDDGDKGSGSEGGSSGEAGTSESGGSSGSGAGGSAGTSGGAAGSGVGGDAGESSGSGGTAAQGGTTSGGTGGTDAGAGGTSGTAGSGGGGNQEPLVPLITGHRSEFRFVALDSSMPTLETCDDPFTEVGEMDTIEGVTGTRYLSFCTDDFVLIEGSGDSLTAHIIDPTGKALGTAIEYIHSPVEDGESWPTGAPTYTWAEVTESLTVPAGTFDDCWERVAPPDIATLTYCRGVGLVVGVHTSNNWRLELVSKNF